MRRTLMLLAMTFAPMPASAQQAPATTTVAPSAALQQRSTELLAILNGGGDPAATFAPAFLAQVPAAQVRAIAAQLAGSMGRALAVASVVPASATTATVKIRYERGIATMGLAVANGTAGQIVGLRVLGAGPDIATLPAALDAIRALPGVTGLALAELGSGPPRMLHAIAPDRSMAIGSAFKLVVLAELVRQIEAGQRRWDDTVTLDGTERPAGGYNQMPKGTVVGVRELARQMIAVSDNSATDILIDLLGREKIEAMQATVGIAAPVRNRPWLKTMEAFKLKGVEGGALGTRYLAADEKGRRALLVGEVARAPGSAVGALFADGKPVRPDTLEWFASPTDLVRVMDWLRRHSETGPGAEARSILAVNPGLPQLKGPYRYVGFKGGSEPGVLNLTLLLETPGGRWRVLTASWNNPAAAVNDAQFVGLIGRAAELAAGEVPAR